MDTITFGTFEYVDSLPSKMINQLPSTLNFSSITCESLLIRLLLGQVKIKKHSKIIKNTKQNFFCLPYNPSQNFTFLSINNALTGIDILNNDHQSICDTYFINNRRNNHIYENILFEISTYFWNNKRSSISAFANLYRCLEYISYSFPMIYASKTNDFAGSFSSLKSYFKGDSGEHKFFKYFIEALFNHDPSFLDFQFNIPIEISDPQNILKSDMRIIYPKLDYDYNSGNFTIKFKDMHSFFMDTRNRYFHMSINQGRPNFSSTNYDICEFFQSINPFILNWLSIIIVQISIHGLGNNLST